jgi:hypothetical protein
MCQVPVLKPTGAASSGTVGCVVEAINSSSGFADAHEQLLAAIALQIGSRLLPDLIGHHAFASDADKGMALEEVDLIREMLATEFDDLTTTAAPTSDLSKRRSRNGSDGTGAALILRTHPRHTQFSILSLCAHRALVSLVALRCICACYRQAHLRPSRERRSPCTTDGPPARRSKAR